MKRTYGAAMLFGLILASFQDLPASSTFEVISTPNQNLNSELFAASASSPNDIWAVGQSTIHFDGTPNVRFFSI